MFRLFCLWHGRFGGLASGAAISVPLDVDFGARRYSMRIEPIVISYTP